MIPSVPLISILLSLKRTFPSFSRSWRNVKIRLCVLTTPLIRIGLTECVSFSKCSTTFSTTLILRAISPSLLLSDVSASGVFRLIPHSSKWSHRYWKLMYTSTFWALGCSPPHFYPWTNHFPKTWLRSLKCWVKLHEKAANHYAHANFREELQSRDLFRALRLKDDYTGWFCDCGFRVQNRAVLG